MSQTLTSLSFFAGVGTLIVFFAALALGRFSLAAFKDYDGVAVDSSNGVDAAFTTYQPDPPAQQTYIGGQSQFPSQYPSSATEPFPPGQYPSPAGQYPPATGQYPASAAQQPSPAGQYPQHDPFGLTQDAYPSPQPRSQSPFPPAPYPGPPDQQTIPETTTAMDHTGQDPAGH